ncbi:MAG: hypothetical protein ABI640_18970 [Gammaproteobacteria bacterium]
MIPAGFVTRLVLATSCALALSTADAQAPRSPQGFPGAAPPRAPVLIRELGAEPAAIEPGQSTMLRWDVLNAYAVAIAPDLGNVALRGTQRVTPSATMTYTLTANGPSGDVTRAVTVTVRGTTAATPTAVSKKVPPVPKLADGKPDLSGLYMAEKGVRLLGAVLPAPGAEKFRVETRADDLGTGIQCLPPGVPAASLLPFPLQIVHTPQTFVVMYEAYHQFRIAPVGGEYAEYLAPAYMGHSIARWDGDTLVLDVRGFNTKTVIAGYRHTEDLRVVERFRRTDFGNISYEATVTDPHVFATPLKYAGTFELHPEWEIGEYVCTENNQDYDALFEAKPTPK